MKAKPGMRRWAVIVLCGIISMVILGLVVRKNEFGQQLALPDGTVLTLVNVSYGTRLPFPKASAWQKMTQKFPARISRIINFTPGVDFSGSLLEPALFILFHRSASPTNKITEDAFVTISDESGVEYTRAAEPQYMPVASWGPKGISGERYDLHHSPVFPRRSKKLVLRVYSWDRINSGNIPLINAGEIRITNPAYRAYPQWVPDTLPATRNAGDLAATLTRLEAINDPAERLRFRKKGLRTGTRATFKITQNGKPATQWKPESIRLSDATGNSLYLWAGGLAEQPEDQILSPWRLGMEETAWKLRLELTQRSGFEAGDLYTIRNLSVSGQTAGGDASCQVALPGGKAIIFKRLLRENNWGGNASVEVDVTGKDESFRIALVKVTDQRGQEVEVMRPPPGYGDFSGTLHYFGLQLPEGAQSLNLTFAWKECRFVEFTAKPQEVLVGEQ